LISADAMLTDDDLRLKLLSSQAMTELQPILQGLAQQSLRALDTVIRAAMPGSSMVDMVPRCGLDLDLH
jgi:hypothetical protein